MSSRSKFYRRGFSVIEVLVGLGLFGALVLLTLEGMRLYLTTSKHVKDQERVLDVRAYLRNRINCDKTLLPLIAANQCDGIQYVDLRDGNDTPIVLANASAKIGDYRIRGRCQDVGGFYGISADYLAVNSDGRPAKNPMTQKPADWKILFSTVPVACAQPSRCPLVPGPVQNIGSAAEFKNLIKLGGNFRLTANIFLVKADLPINPAAPLTLVGNGFRLGAQAGLFSAVDACFDNLQYWGGNYHDSNAIAISFKGQILNSKFSNIGGGSPLIGTITGPSEFAGLTFGSRFVGGGSNNALAGLANAVNAPTTVRNSSFDFKTHSNEANYSVGGLFQQVNAPTTVKDSTFKVDGGSNTGRYELGGIAFRNTARLDIRNVEMNFLCDTNVGHFNCAGLVFKADSEVVVDGFKVTMDLHEASNRANTASFAGAIYQGNGPTSLSNGTIQDTNRSSFSTSLNYGGVYNQAKNAKLSSINVEFGPAANCSKAYYRVKQGNVPITNSTCRKR